MSMLTFTLMVVGTYIGLVFAIRHARDFSIITSAWQHIFEGLQFSSEDFYTKLEEAVNAKEMKGVSITRFNLSQGVALSNEISADRIYLRIRRGDWMILVCAAPFAKDFFVSYRVGAPRNGVKNFILSIPIIGFLGAKLLYRKTYFIEDTDAMFTDTVKNCVKEVIDQMVQSKGVRPMSEFEGQSFLVGNMQNLYS